jgi:hypothetical protein
MVGPQQISFGGDALYFSFAKNTLFFICQEHSIFHLPRTLYVLSLCMIMAVNALLVGRSQSFASLRFVLSMSSTRASNFQKPSFAIVSIINSYAWYLQAIPSKFSCATFKKTFQILLIL